MIRRRPDTGWLSAPGAAVVLVLLAVGAFLGGVATAALSVSGGTENGDGAASSVSALTWWTLKTTAVDVVPNPAPLPVSSVAATPTVLPSVNGSLAFATATAGDGAVRLDFQEKGATASTELEVAVTFLNISGVATSALVYLETQTTVPAGTLQFSLYLDTGAGAVLFLRITDLTQQCASVGSCP